jgi:hypothetical protein
MGIMLVLLSMAIYMGTTSYIQQELQKVATAAANAGAAAFYDTTDANGLPLANAATATTAANSVFSNTLTQATVLQNAQTALQGAPIVAGDGTVQVTAQSTLATPLLAFFGIQQFGLNAVGRARPVRMVLTSPATLTPDSGVFMREVALPEPLMDRPGVDIAIETQPPFRGYMVEACSNNTCYDITGAARPRNGGFALDQPVGNTGTQRRVLYGPASIDLGATSSRYTAGVRKATMIRFLDDGVYDHFDAAGNRQVEILPQPLIINRMELYHYATACPATGNCPIPPFFQPY